jgi:hypothetical protein
VTKDSNVRIPDKVKINEQQKPQGVDKGGIVPVFLGFFVTGSQSVLPKVNEHIFF